MTSTERVMQYTSLPSEVPENKVVKSVPNDWPHKADIKFENVSFAYDVGLPKVLRNVSFQINASETVGVVGRTGAGKSTIFQTLFRMAEPDGKVFIDGVNIKDISLNDLRSRISIIPVGEAPTGSHDPEIFFNLFLNHSKNLLCLEDLCDTTSTHSGNIRMTNCGKH
jgi:ABC-type multidrug transport system fused ATPase/permease subunit